MTTKTAHECETPIDGSIQHRWKCKKCGQVWEVVGFDEHSGDSIYEEVEIGEQEENTHQ